MAKAHIMHLFFIVNNLSFTFQFCNVIDHVLVPEVLVKIYMDISGNNRQASEEYLRI